MPLELLRGSQAPHRAVCGTRGSLRTMHGGGSAPSCCAFTHRVAFEEGSGPRVLFKRGPGNRGRSACGITHVARLKFPRETGLILRCAGKAGNPFQTTQGNRISRGTTRISGSLSCGAREVRSPCTWRGGACHGSPVMVGESRLKTFRSTLSVFLESRQKTQGSLNLCL